MLFFFLLWDLSSPHGPVCAPSTAALNGKHQQPLTARCRPDKPALTDKAEQLWSTTELNNTNANIQLYCRVVPRCLQLRFDWISPQDPTWPNQIPHCLSVRALLIAKIGNGNHRGLFQHGVFKRKDVLLSPFGGTSWSYGPLLAALSLLLMHLLCLLMRNAILWTVFLLSLSDFWTYWRSLKRLS